MTEEPQPLVLDLVEWVARKPRSYADVMDAWRTSCPRLTIWEDAQDQDLVRRYRSEAGTTYVAATEHGRRVLAASGRL